MGGAGGGEPSKILAQAVGPYSKRSGPLHLLGPAELILSPVHRGLIVSPAKEHISVERKNCSTLSDKKPMKQIKGATSMHNWKEGGRRDDQIVAFSLENDDSRYVTPNHEDFPSTTISVFGRPLLMGGSSVQDGSLKLKKLDNLEPLRMVTADGRE